MNIRKNAAALTAAEWARYMNAVVKVKHTFGYGSDISVYDQFVATHWAVTRIAHGPDTATRRNGAHGGAAFLPWHREYLRRFEVALQSVEPGVTIPFWNWGLGSDEETATLFSDDRIGPLGAIATGYLAPTATAENPLGFLVRADLDGGRGTTLARRSTLTGLPRAADLRAALAEPNYNLTGGQLGFRRRLEAPHGTVHVRLGQHMMTMGSPNDPIFWLHHAQVDRIWAIWQKDHPGSANYNPLDQGRYGHRLNDRMWPWDGGESGTEDPAIAALLPTYAATDIVHPADVLDWRALGVVYDNGVFPMGPSGGAGGTRFEDSGGTGIPVGGRLTRIRIRHGAWIDAIGITYELNGQVFDLAMHGGQGGALSEFVLNADEHVTGIRGRYGRFVDSIFIETNQRTSQRFGGPGGAADYEYRLDPGFEVAGFIGQSGIYVDALGVIYRDVA